MTTSCMKGEHAKQSRCRAPREVCKAEVPTGPPAGPGTALDPRLISAGLPAGLAA